MRRRLEAGPSRARLTPETVGRIVGLIDDWPANRLLTWDDVVRDAETHLRHRWTRQGLERHTPIKRAFEAKRRAFQECKRTGKSVKRRLPEHEIRDQRNIRLARELAEVRRTLAQYDDLFARYHNNA